LPRDPGLHDVLSGEAEPGAVTRDLSVNGTGSLQVIPSGTPTSHSASFLEDPVFERLLETAKANVDMLIIDTPPLNILADAAAIASKVDAVLLVVRRGLTDRDALDLTIERLHRTGVPIVSVILNDVVLPRRYASYSRG
jgi:Mrp family chromosome partitioning ATPase